MDSFFVAKTIYALRPESFCALKVAIRKVQTFWASANQTNQGNNGDIVRHWCSLCAEKDEYSSWKLIENTKDYLMTKRVMA